MRLIYIRFICLPSIFLFKRMKISPFAIIPTKLSFIVFWLFPPQMVNTQPYIGSGKTIDPYHYTINKQQTYLHAAVACAHPLAALVGKQMMKMGGNAIDAAIATQLALAVVYPGAGNIGGGGFMVVRLGKKTFTIDYRETAPAAVQRDMYLNEKGTANTTLSQYGHLASGIPGTIKGLFECQRYARLPFSKLIEPAITLAEKGFVLTETEAGKLNKAQDAFIKYNTILPVFVKAGGWKKGDTLIQKALAKTLKRIQKSGIKDFYEGETAKLILAEMKRGNGLITSDDLKNYTVISRKPLQFDYKGFNIITMPPPSSGGILLCQMLRMVSRFPLPEYGFTTAKSVHLMAEVERRAFADRATHLGDPSFWKVPVEKLINNKYLLQRMADYDSTSASKSSAIQAGNAESTETTHISISDQWGNAVSITTTLNGTFGSKTVVGGAGFLLNNEMDDFSIKPGVPNMYGAIGGEANAIAPGKRMLSSMTPTIVTKDNNIFLIVGTPGGTTIPTSVFQTIVDVVDFKMSIENAVNSPKFHHQWLPDRIDVEANFPEMVRTQLTQMGHTVSTYSIAGYASNIGRVEALQYVHGKINAVADSRGDDAVAGW